MGTNIGKEGVNEGDLREGGRERGRVSWCGNLLIKSLLPFLPPSLPFLTFSGDTPKRNSVFLTNRIFWGWSSEGRSS